MRRIRNIFAVAVSVVLMGMMLCACSSEETSGETYESAENAAITSDWKLDHFSVNGHVTRADEFTGNDVELLPGFVATDETSCVFYNSGKAHPGTMELIDGVYNITYPDSENGVGMQATVSGDTLTIVNTKGTMEFVFFKE